LAAETLISLVLEIYRPRVKGRIGPPLYESRTIGLLGQPEGIVSTVAHTLDYQFGFKVSETWFYSFCVNAFSCCLRPSWPFCWFPPVLFLSKPVSKPSWSASGDRSVKYYNPDFT